MKWDQIENKWTAMSRRLRPERCRLEEAYRAPPPVAADKSDRKAPIEAERTSAHAASAVRQDG